MRTRGAVWGVVLTLATIQVAWGAGIELKRVFIVSQVEDGLPDISPKDVLLTQKVTLYPVLEVVLPGRPPQFFSSAAKFQMGQQTYTPLPLSFWDSGTYGPLTVGWYKVEPRPRHVELPGNDPNNPGFKGYSNVALAGSAGRKQYLGIDKLEYFETRLPQYDGVWKIPADAHPSDRKQDTHKGLGVMRHKVEIGFQSTPRIKSLLGSPGPEYTDQWGIRREVHRVSFRQDNTFPGHLQMFLNVPQVHGAVKQQAENFLGADNTDLLVAAYRRFSGGDWPEYGSLEDLFTQLPVRHKELFLNIFGKLYLSPLPSPGTPPINLIIGGKEGINIGDVLLLDFPGPAGSTYGTWDSIGVVYEDRGPEGKPNGVLDPDDLIFSVFEDGANVDALKSSRFVKNAGITRVAILGMRVK